MHLRDAARQASLTPAALQRETSALVTQKILNPRRDGNRVYYRANTAHPLFPDLHGIVIKITGIAPALRDALLAVKGVDLAMIFSSIASGNARASSDMDLLILGEVGLREISPALRGITQNLGREINPICFTSTEWRDRSARGDALAARFPDDPIREMIDLSWWTGTLSTATCS